MFRAPAAQLGMAALAPGLQWTKTPAATDRTPSPQNPFPSIPAKVLLVTLLASAWVTYLFLTRPCGPGEVRALSSPAWVRCPQVVALVPSGQQEMPRVIWKERAQFGHISDWFLFLFTLSHSLFLSLIFFSWHFKDLWDNYSCFLNNFPKATYGNAEMEIQKCLTYIW